MKKLAFLAVMVGVSSTATAYSTGELLTGDEKLSCEAILCLATSTRPSECSPALKRYFGIKHRKPHDTFKARLNFLNICPKDTSDLSKEQLAKIGIDKEEQDSNMATLTNAIANLPHDCLADTLNQQVERKCLIYGDHNHCDEWGYRIKPDLPKACKTLASHNWTVVDLPEYKGDRSWFNSRQLAPVWFDKAK